MRFISLFSGIGGMDLGLEWAGWECVAQVEIDDYCQQVLTKHWPDIPKWRNIYDVKGSDLPAADAIVGGFPCQPHSVAGKRKGAADDRNLWPEYLRLIKEIRPEWIVGENVPGLRTTMLDEVLSDLESADYATTTLNLPAVAFDAPHLRYRLFIVAHPKEQPIGTGLCKNESSQQRGRRLSNKSSKTGDVPDTESEFSDGRNNYTGISSCTKSVSQPRNSSWSEDVADTDDTRSQRRDSEIMRERASQCTAGTSGASGTAGRCDSWWSVEPAMGQLVNGVSGGLVRFGGRTATGIPNRVAKLRGLGNAVVPQVAEWIGRIILENDLRPSLSPTSPASKMVPEDQTNHETSLPAIIMSNRRQYE
jgi:DNA (cytosine-5)-methyltransferase 1